MATHRPSSSSPTASMADHHETDEPKEYSPQKIQYNFNLMCPFNIPSTPEETAFRTIRNLSYFRLYYTLFVWVILCITLVPERKVSLIFLVAMSAVAYLYALVLYILPSNLVVPYKTIDKRLIFALLAISTMVELILTRAAIHLFVTLAATTPVILLHAVLWAVGDHLLATEEACAAGGLFPFAYKKIDDAKAVDLV